MSILCLCHSVCGGGSVVLAKTVTLLIWHVKKYECALDREVRRGDIDKHFK